MAEFKGLSSEQAVWLRGVMHGVIDQEEADDWLTTPDPSLDGRTPVQAVEDGDVGGVWARLRSFQTDAGRASEVLVA